jgi:hypothetical protein
MVHKIHMQPVGTNMDCCAMESKQLTVLLNETYVNK